MKTKHIIGHAIIVIAIVLVFVESAAAKVCEQHDFGSTDNQYYIYSSGKTWDFIAEKNMSVEAIEVKSVLATQTEGTFYVQIEINGQSVTQWNEYVSSTYYQPFIYSENVYFNVQQGDTITYRIWGNFYSNNLGAISGPNYVKFCGLDNLIISPDTLRDDYFTSISYFDSPGSAPCSLAFDGTYLWSVDGDNRKLYKTDISGNIVDFFDAPFFYCCSGLAFDGTDLWIGDTSYNNYKIHRMDTAGNIINTFDAPAADPHGLAFDGTYLWGTSSNTTANKVYQMDTFGNVISSFDSPGNGYKGLAFDGTYLWQVDAVTNTIYKFNLSGTVMTSFRSQAAIPTGLASDGTHLWLSTKDEDRIYQLGIPQSVKTGDTKRVSFTMTNTGVENLVVGSLLLMGIDADAFSLQNDNLSGSTLHPAGTGTFDVVFAPASPGARKATLRIPLSFPESAELNMPLKWTAFGAVKGDLNGDDDLNLIDAIISMQTLSGLNTSAYIRTGYPSSGADINEDNSVGLAEAIYILQGLSQLR
jgi:hypothetical protein